MPRSTVTRVLGARRPQPSRASLEPSGPVQRYEWPHVGDLLHVDLKRLGRVVGIGHRIHGDRRRRARRVGWEYLHVAIDDATRLTYAEVLARRRCTRRARRSCIAPSRWFRRRGVSIRRLLTDNAMAYRARASRAPCRTLGRPSALHPALSTADQRQGRAIHPNTAPRVGLPEAVSELGATHDGASVRICASITTGGPMRASVGARRGRVSKRLPKMNNLFDIHS